MLDSTGVGPIFGGSDKPNSHRIISNIIPLLRVAFIRTQDVIERIRVGKAL